MIPTIGIMIGGYIVLRCVDIFCRPLSAFSSRAGRTVMILLAVLVILVTMVSMLDLMSSGSSVPRGLTP